MSNLIFPIEIYFLFFVMSALYSSVGHGGASAYIAVLTIFGIYSRELINIPLVLNVFVASVSFYHFYKNGFFKKDLLLPFVLTSVPASFIGATLKISDNTFKIILAIALILSAIRLLFLNKVQVKIRIKQTFLISAIIGLVLGLVSGLIGIGGGIFLSPIILFLGWGDTKTTAATSSAFIVLNSMSSLIAITIKKSFNYELLIPFIIVVLFGGYFGALFGNREISVRKLQFILGVVIFISGIKIIYQI